MDKRSIFRFVNFRLYCEHNSREKKVRWLVFLSDIISFFFTIFSDIIENNSSRYVFSLFLVSNWLLSCLVVSEWSGLDIGGRNLVWDLSGLVGGLCHLVRNLGFLDIITGDLVRNYGGLVWSLFWIDYMVLIFDKT